MIATEQCLGNKSGVGERSKLLNGSNGCGHNELQCANGSLPPLSVNEYEEVQQIRRILYCSHAIAKFAERAWQFSISIFLAAFTGYKSLFLVSTYGLFSGLSSCVFGSFMGKYVDRTERIYAAKFLLLSQNSLVILATICSFLLLSHEPKYFHADQHESDSTSSAYILWLHSRVNNLPCDSISIFFLLIIHVFGVAANLLDETFQVAIEKDWIVVLSQHANNRGLKQAKYLIDINVMMKQIDLSCKLLSPTIVGIGMAFCDLRVVSILIGILNLISIVIEYISTTKIYKKVPELATKIRSTTEILPKSQQQKERNQEPSNNYCTKVNGFHTYVMQPIVFGGISLSLLHMNVLTFGPIMTAYLVSEGFSMSLIGVLRGVSCMMGLFGTFLFKHLSLMGMSLESSGFWAVTFQFTCLSLSYFSLYISDSLQSLIGLIVGVCMSRVGLWIFDISINQLMQISVNEDVRGIVGGTQNALNAFMGLTAFALGLIFPDPSDFHIYVLTGYLAVGLAAANWYFGVYRKQPLPKLS